MITIDISTSEVKKYADELIKRINDFSQPFESIGQTITTHLILSAEKELDPYSSPWLQLSQQTIAQRRKADSSVDVKILRDTGLMYGGLSYRADKTNLYVGFDKEYSRHHQKGEGVPKRLIIFTDELGIPSDVSRDIVDDIISYLEK